MRYGIIVNAGGPRDMADLAAEAEAAGWDGVFYYDAIAIGESEMFDPWAVLAAMAMRTERGTRVFFGAYDPAVEPKGLMERFTRLMPAARDALPAGDFRDWPEIEAWADSIADELAPVAAGR